MRYFASARGGRFRQDARLVARYTLTLWGVAVAVLGIALAVNEEVVERDYPTPHEWRYLTRKYLRDANNYLNARNGEVNWARALELSRGVILRLEDDKLDGKSVHKLSDKVDPTLEVPGEFIACDINAKSEEWNRGYFEALMLAAKTAEHVDGWVRDTTRNIVSPPQYMIGPSNLRPTPVPIGDPAAPREENCVPAYPDADNWYRKILATNGFTARQKLEAALAYASFLEFNSRFDEAESLYAMALSEATIGMEPKQLPFDSKTHVLNNSRLPSANVLETITAIANFKARKGDISSALPMYLSLLKARRSLPTERPVDAKSRMSESIVTKLVNLVSQPPYPPPPPDGTQIPWRSPEERCQEASLNLYVGEILYATKSKVDGLSWTRDGVDLAEEQLRELKLVDKTPSTQKVCRECLSTGLENWKAMVSNLAAAEKRKAKAGGSNASGIFSFMTGAQEVEGRWEAEEAVVTQRVRRTRELLDDIRPPKNVLWGWLKA